MKPNLKRENTGLCIALNTSVCIYYMYTAYSTSVVFEIKKFTYIVYAFKFLDQIVFFYKTS